LYADSKLVTGCTKTNFVMADMFWVLGKKS
jgi:hypothetical protein